MKGITAELTREFLAGSLIGFGIGILIGLAIAVPYVMRLFRKLEQKGQVRAMKEMELTIVPVDTLPSERFIDGPPTEAIKSVTPFDSDI